MGVSNAKHLPWLHMSFEQGGRVISKEWGGLSKVQRQWQGERQQTKGLTSGTMAVQVSYKSLCTHFSVVLC